ncbi:MAG TPA: hypothetical protein VMW62_06670 [Chloroflexota bacterium]|nr:hypothetical protein [Chloroflexota bacterium]
MPEAAPAGLHTVALAPINSTRPRWLVPVASAAAFIIALAAATLTYAGRRAPATAARPVSLPAPVAPTPAPRAFYSPSPGQSVPFEICYYNGAWSLPDPDAQAQHIQADPRYRGLDLSRQPLERVHVELGPFRSASALGDFVQLSGLWTDPNATAAACPADLQGKAELWALELRFERVELSGADLTAFAQPLPAGVEVIQLPLPAPAEALHIIDDRGLKLSPDVSLRAPKLESAPTGSRAQLPGPRP